VTRRVTSHQKESQSFAATVPRSPCVPGPLASVARSKDDLKTVIQPALGDGLHQGRDAPGHSHGQVHLDLPGLVVHLILDLEREPRVVGLGLVSADERARDRCLVPCRQLSVGGSGGLGT